MISVVKPGSKLTYLNTKIKQFSPAGSSVIWWQGAYAAFDFTGSKNANDLTGNGNNGSFVEPVFWSAGVGLTGNADGYITTSITPAANQTWSAIAKFSGLTLGAGGLYAPFGSLNSTDGFRFYTFPLLSLDRVAYLYGGFSAQVIGANGSGVANGTIGFAGKTGYKNGVADLTIPTVSGVNPPSIWMLAVNSSGSPIYEFPGYVSSFAIFNSTLSAAQMAALHSTMP